MYALCADRQSLVSDKFRGGVDGGRKGGKFQHGY